MEIHITDNGSKPDIFRQVQACLDALGLPVSGMDEERPWGGFFTIEESGVRKFIEVFFQGNEVKDLQGKNKVSPKILLVSPGKRLSWQYHKRRAEIWKIVQGTVEMVISDTDEEAVGKIYNAGDRVLIGKGQRHRVKALQEWAIIAEIWQHSDNNHPSDEEDIIRLKDDFGRGD